MIMKRNIKKFLLPVVAAVAVTFAACSDWTETESLDIHYPSIDEQNPALYRKYLESLRNYKAGDHKVVFATMNNSTEAPGQRNEHLTTMPDSVDFICLTNPANLHPTLVKEIGQVHEKGTRVVYNIDYNAIEKLWQQKLEEEEANKPDEPETPDTPDTPDTPVVAQEQEGGEGEGGDPVEPEETEETRFLKFCEEQTALQLAHCDRYGFDGISFTYTGRALESMTEEVKAIWAARQEAFLSGIRTWAAAHEGKLLFFQGSPQNLIDKTILGDCDHIIIPLLSATSGDQLSYGVLMAAVEGVPADRFIVGVKTVSPTDESDERGYFAGLDSDGKSRLRATKGAAQWVVTPAAGYTKSGIAVDEAHNDYYNITLVYKNIREAISIMNPAPKN